MKKFLSAVLTAILAFTLALTAFSVECEHNYTRTVFPANCQEKGFTQYLCRKCGYSYKVYDDTYEVPDGFYILATSTRDDDALTLTVTVELYNNPGLSTARLPVGYNADTLAFRELCNGEIWSERDIKYLDTTKNPFSFTTEDYTTPDMINKNNGHYFTVIFDIIDPEGAYGIYFPYLSGDFPMWDHENNTIIKHSPTFISLVGKSEPGPHSYESTVTPPTCAEEGYTTNVCTICSHTSVSDRTPKTEDHTMELSAILTPPTVTEEGVSLYVCAVCGIEEKRSVPVLERYMKGDLNNDQKVNSIDANLLRRVILHSSSDLQMLDAADINDDGKINGLDSNILTRRFIGG